jgi:hypothetical protein
LASRTIIPIENVLRDFGLNAGGDIFNDSRTNAVFSLTSLERAAALGTAFQAMLFPPVDAIAMSLS